MLGGGGPAAGPAGAGGRVAASPVASAVGGPGGRVVVSVGGWFMGRVPGVLRPRGGVGVYSIRRRAPRQAGQSQGDVAGVAQFLKRATPWEWGRGQSSG